MAAGTAAGAAARRGRAGRRPGPRPRPRRRRCARPACRCGAGRADDAPTPRRSPRPTGGAGWRGRRARDTPSSTASPATRWRRAAGGGAAIPELRICVPLGALFEDSVEALGRAGLDVAPLRDAGRRLVVEAADGTTYITTRPSDVPTYVESGAADIGHRRQGRAPRAHPGRLRAARPALRRLPHGLRHARGRGPDARGARAPGPRARGDQVPGRRHRPTSPPPAARPRW